MANKLCLVTPKLWFSRLCIAGISLTLLSCVSILFIPQPTPVSLEEVNPMLKIFNGSYCLEHQLQSWALCPMPFYKLTLISHHSSLTYCSRFTKASSTPQNHGLSWALILSFLLLSPTLSRLDSNLCPCEATSFWLWSLWWKDLCPIPFICWPWSGCSTFSGLEMRTNYENNYERHSLKNQAMINELALLVSSTHTNSSVSDLCL